MTLVLPALHGAIKAGTASLRVVLHRRPGRRQRGTGSGEGMALAEGLPLAVVLVPCGSASACREQVQTEPQAEAVTVHTTSKLTSAVELRPWAAEPLQGGKRLAHSGRMEGLLPVLTL